MKRKVYKKFTEEDVSLITSMYADGKSGQEIAEHFGMSYKSMRSHLNLAGVKGHIVWTQKKLDWLKNNYNLTYKEMENNLNLNAETIRLKIKDLGLERTSRYRPFKIDPNDEQFFEDIKNPRLSAPDIVRKYKDKYGIGESRIHQLRKQEGIKLQINHLEHFNELELIVKDILDSLDVMHTHSKRIGNFTLDFYLGFKSCIEVQGSYWHSKPKKIEQDKRKQEKLTSDGYNILYLHEDDKENFESKIIEYLQSRGFPVLRSTEKLPCERKQKRCVKKVS